VIVDQKFARRFWPHGDAVGKHVWFDPKKPFTIAGVVGTVKEYGLDTEGKIVTYFPATQNAGNNMYLVARTTSDPAAMAAAVVREIHAVDPGVAVYDVRTMDGRVYDSLARQRFATTMLSAFAAVRADARRGGRVRRDAVPGDAERARYRGADRAGGAERQYFEPGGASGR
jgi:hypothetical protein